MGGRRRAGERVVSQIEALTYALRQLHDVGLAQRYAEWYAVNGERPHGEAFGAWLVDG